MPSPSTDTPATLHHHEHAHPGRAHSLGLGFSWLTAGVVPRLMVASVASLILWGAMWWALR